MNNIMNYFGQMLLPGVFGILAAEIVRFIVLKIKRQRVKDLKILHETALAIFFGILAAIFYLTNISEIEHFSLDISNARINLLPFKVIFETAVEVYINNNMTYFVINLLGNILIFLPVGILCPILWKNVGLLKTAGIGALISLVIEVSQLFVGRACDIDDIILNASGAVIGFLIYRVLNRYIDFSVFKNGGEDGFFR